jgi:hypothetical protein
MPSTAKPSTARPTSNQSRSDPDLSTASVAEFIDNMKVAKVSMDKAKKLHTSHGIANGSFELMKGHIDNGDK